MIIQRGNNPKRKSLGRRNRGKGSPTHGPNFVSPAPKKNKLNKNFTKFMEVFKKLHINIPFADPLEQMPSYVKFMKDILSQKRRLSNFETVNLTEECSVILQKKLL